MLSTVTSYIKQKREYLREDSKLSLKTWRNRDLPHMQSYKVSRGHCHSRVHLKYYQLQAKQTVGLPGHHCVKNFSMSGKPFSQISHAVQLLHSAFSLDWVCVCKCVCGVTLFILLDSTGPEWTTILACPSTKNKYMHTQKFFSSFCSI